MVILCSLIAAFVFSLCRLFVVILNVIETKSTIFTQRNWFNMLNKIIIKLNEGGPFFTYPILVFLLISILLFVWALTKASYNNKLIYILKQLGWLSIAWGVLGRTFGLITAFDTLREYKELTPQLLGDGLKMALLSPMLGVICFILIRVIIMVLIIASKKSTFTPTNH